MAEAFNSQMVELRSSQLDLKTSLETKLESTVSDFNSILQDLHVDALTPATF
ncbi:hypothetical protein COLO4_24900 [Corchorus olitorius]|uniref:Uncharacterized protein n=1 Tax=Corchorus olitorius TaxID=93759 RepID=A0A1R3I5X5_9ROSI|nr:hypothetical protein COLO4_24900 [Corchorus olitorius]